MSSSLHFLAWNSWTAEPPSYQTAKLTEAPFIHVHSAVKHLKSARIYLRDNSNNVILSKD